MVPPCNMHFIINPRSLQSAAVQAIDEILHRRGHLSLIAGQPLHPLPKSNAAPSPSKKVKRPSHASDPMPSQNQAPSVARQNTSSTKAVPQRAESSKQASSSQTSQSVAYNLCVLCKQGIHPLNDCPLVRAGSKRCATVPMLLKTAEFHSISSIAEHIALLEKDSDPSSKNITLALRDLLVKAKFKEMSAPGN